MKKRVLPPVYFVGYLIGAVVLNRVIPLARVVQPPANYVGALLILAGAALNLWSAGLFRQKGTTIKPFESSSVLVIEAPFKFSRNPMYVGGVTFLLGVAVFLGSVTAFLAPWAMFLTLQNIFIPTEEAMLEEKFGQSFRDYKQRTHRWL